VAAERGVELTVHLAKFHHTPVLSQYCHSVVTV
jgi:hypothetical protein